MSLKGYLGSHYHSVLNIHCNFQVFSQFKEFKISEDYFILPVLMFLIV